MKLYQANGTNSFQVVERENNAPPEYVRMKVSMIYPTRSDVNLFDGRARMTKPMVPCGIATAVVSEDRLEFGLKRGTKVILNPYVQGKTPRYLQPPTYGVEEEGFLRDFVALPIENIVPFPEEVREKEGLFTTTIAVALGALNALKLEQGDYIAIVGGSLLTNVIAQLALYYQCVPILITSDPRFLDLAEKSGIYYTINDVEEDAAARVRAITGGRMAEHTVLHAQKGVTGQFLFSLTMQGGDALVACMTGMLPRVEVDLSQVATKSLSVHGCTSGKEEFASAVNILAQKILKLDHFIDKTVPLNESELLFRDLSEEYERYLCAVIKVP